MGSHWQAVAYCCLALVLSTCIVHYKDINYSLFHIRLHFSTHSAAQQQQRVERELLEESHRHLEREPSVLVRRPLPQRIKNFLYQIEWLHIPKTGTSFGNLLVNWACPELEQRVWMRESGVSRDLPQYCLERFRRYPHISRPKLPIGDHWTLEERSEEQLRTIFTMVRNPKSRLASGFHFRTRYQQLAATPQEMCSLINNSTYAHSSRGAQVKIILGTHKFVDRHFHFASPEPPTLYEAQEACDRMSKFAFVGITDFWHATVCLFHREHGGQVHSSELVNVRSGNRFHRKKPPVTQVDCHDDADEYLYQCALKIFYDKLYKHPHCQKFMIQG